MCVEKCVDSEDKFNDILVFTFGDNRNIREATVDEGSMMICIDFKTQRSKK